MGNVEEHNVFDEPKRSKASSQEQFMAPDPVASGSQLTPITMTLEALRPLVNFIVQNGGTHASAPSPRSIAEDNMKNIPDFMSFNPPAFDDSSDDLDVAYEWILDLESIFDLVQFEDELRVRCAVFMLKGNARHWWELVGQARISWQGFKDMFFDRYYPEPVRAEKEEEFLNLRQGNMSVYEYEREFEKLARFAPDLVNTQSKMARCFVSGLRKQIRGQVALQCPTNYSSALRYARILDHGSSYGQKRKHQQIS